MRFKSLATLQIMVSAGKGERVGGRQAVGRVWGRRLGSAAVFQRCKDGRLSAHS